MLHVFHVRISRILHDIRYVQNSFQDTSRHPICTEQFPGYFTTSDMYRTVSRILHDIWYVQNRFLDTSRHPDMCRTVSRILHNIRICTDSFQGTSRQPDMYRTVFLKDIFVCTRNIWCHDYDYYNVYKTVSVCIQAFEHSQMRMWTWLRSIPNVAHTHAGLVPVLSVCSFVWCYL